MKDFDWFKCVKAKGTLRSNKYNSIKMIIKEKE